MRQYGSAQVYETLYLDPVDGNAWAKEARAGINGPLLGILVFSIGLMSTWRVGDTGSWVSLTSQIVVAYLGAMVVLGAAMKGTPLVFSRECVLYAMFLMWVLAGVPFAAFGEAAREGAITLAKLLGMFFIVLNSINGFSAYRWYLGALIAAAATTTVLGMVGYSTTGASGRAAATMGSANEYGMFLCLALWGALSIAVSTRRRSVKFMMVCACIALVGLAANTGSRMAMLTLMIMCGGMYWFVFRKSAASVSMKLMWPVIIALGLVGLFVYLTTTTYWDRMIALAEVLQGTGKEGSADARIRFLKDSLAALQDNPIMGVGYACLSYEFGGRSPHNSILAIASETGLIGWGLLFSAWSLPVVRMIKLDRMDMPLHGKQLMQCGWLLYMSLGLWVFCGEMHKHKLVWAALAAQLGYTLWLERTYARSSTGTYAGSS